MTPEELRAFRERLGWSLSRLAEALGVDRMTVWKWERGTHAPPPFLRLALERLEELERDPP